MDTIKIPAIVFKSGDYTNIGRSIYTNKDLETIVNRTNAFGLQAVKFKEKSIPITLEHIDTENTIDLGEAVVGSFSKAGEYVKAMLEIPKAALEIIKSRFLSVEIGPKDKIIKKITITNDPVISDAQFSNKVSERDEDVEYFSFSISQEGDSNMVEDLVIEETENVESEAVELEAEEVAIEGGVEVAEPILGSEDFSLAEDVAEAVCETVEAVLEEAVVEKAMEDMPEELMQDMASEDMGCSTDKKKEEDMGMSEDQKRIAELEARLAELEDEQMSKSIESYSKGLVSQGVPAVIADELSPWLAMEGNEKFSQHNDYILSAKKVIEFFADPKMFSAKLREENKTDFIKTEDQFSEKAIINKVRAECAKEGIELYSEKYKDRLAKAMFSQA